MGIVGTARTAIAATRAPPSTPPIWPPYKPVNRPVFKFCFTAVSGLYAGSGAPPLGVEEGCRNGGLDGYSDLPNDRDGCAAAPSEYKTTYRQLTQRA